VKSHWPQTGYAGKRDSWVEIAAELSHGSRSSIDAAVADAFVYDGAIQSMDFDKVMLMVRHPFLSMHSFTTRWSHEELTSAAVWNAASEVYCWSVWWSRVLAALPRDEAMTVRYEDICQDPDAQVDRALNFLGYKRILEKASEGLSCHASHSLEDVIQAYDAVKPGLSAELGRFLQPILTLWGYAPVHES